MCLLRLFVGGSIVVYHSLIVSCQTEVQTGLYSSSGRFPGCRRLSSLAGTSLHLLAPKVRQKLLSLRKTTVEVRKLSTGLLWSCSIETITPSILVGRQVFLALPEGLQPSFDYVYINTYRVVTSSAFERRLRGKTRQIAKKTPKLLI